MIQINNYNIHNLVKFQIRTENKSLLKGLNFPLSYFEVIDEIGEPDLILNIGKFTPSNSDSYIVDHRYYINEDYFYCKDVGKTTRWEVEIIGFENPPMIINFHGKTGGIFRYLAPDLLAQDIMLFPFVELLLFREGYLLAHGGGIAKEGNAIIFLGRGGSLKTSIVMKAVRNGFKIFGDDRVILQLKDKTAYCFPVYPQIFGYLIKNLNDEHMNIYEKLLLFMHLLKESRQNSNIWQSKPIDLKVIYLLKRKERMNDKIQIHSVIKSNAIHKIISNNRAETYITTIPSSITHRNFMTYMIAYSFIFPDSKILTYWDELKDSLQEALRDVPVYEMEIPKKYSPNVFQEVLDAVTGI